MYSYITVLIQVLQYVRPYVRICNPNIFMIVVHMLVCPTPYFTVMYDYAHDDYNIL